MAGVTLMSRLMRVFDGVGAEWCNPLALHSIQMADGSGDSNLPSL